TVSLRGDGLKLRGLHRLSQVEQEAGRGLERVMEDQVAVDRHRGGAQRQAFLVDQERPAIAMSVCRAADSERGSRDCTELDEAPAFHRYRLYPFSLCSTVSSPSVSSSLATRMPATASTSLRRMNVSTPDQTAVTTTPISWVMNCSPMVTFSG